MESPQISRSGRVLKKSAKVKEMEDFDINELDMQGKPKKKSRLSDDYDDFDDKRVAPIKIPKISFNTPTPKRPPTLMPKMQVQGRGMKQEKGFMGNFSPNDSKESDSSSMSSDSSSSGSDSSDEGEMVGGRQIPMHRPQEKVVVEQYTRQMPFEAPAAFVDHSNEMSLGASDDEASDSALVIAEESSDSIIARHQKAVAGKRRMPKKEGAAAAPRKPASPKKRPAAASRTPAAKKEKIPGKSKPLTAYMLWCSENRKKIAASGTVGFGNIGKKLGELWQALPDKEKMAWRSKAKRLALKSAGGLISTGPSVAEPAPAPKAAIVRSAATSSAADALMGLSEGGRPLLGTSAIDSAAYLKLLGDSLSVIGQRLTEHEGQLAVSGIFSVLLDTVLCVVGPLVCLASESPPLAPLPQETARSTLDSIAYFMPGL